MATAFLDAPGPLAFAHRGGAAHAPENSWRAFEHAVGLGYRYLETDLQATADGVLVAFHDRTLTRVCGQGGQVRQLTHAELAAARIDGTEPIPVLEDLLAAWPDVRFNLDVKDVPAIAPLPEVLRRTNAWDRVCVVSFSASRLRATRQALGLQVHAWTVNDRPTMERLLDLGIDGIMTDETVALRDVLAARHQWYPRKPADQ